MKSEFDRKLAAGRKFVRSLFRKKIKGEFLFFSLLPTEIRLIIWKMAITAHPHPRVHTLLYGLITGTVIPKKKIRIDNDFCGKFDTPARNKITIKANCTLIQTCKEARGVALNLYSRYINVRTCDGRHHPSCLITQRRQLGFWKGSANRKIEKKWCAKDCQGRAYFTSDQIVYLPDMLWFAPAWAGEKAVEHLALPILAFATWIPERVIALLKKFKSLKRLNIILIPEDLDIFILSLDRTPHGYRAPKRDADIEERLEGYVLSHWDYENCHKWWKKLPGVEMSILYLRRDTLRRSYLITKDERRMELENLEQKINDHLQDMETWTEEP